MSAIRFEDIEPLLGGVKCFGFDVFDTLILRPFMRPDDLFSYLEDRESAEGFKKERINAERRARREIHEEAGIDEIYSLMDRKFMRMRDPEIEAERRLTFADPHMKELYDRVIALGIDVIMISDMYLPEDSIVHILEKNGYTGYRKVYVSNECRRNKHSGKLFDVVLEDMKIRPEEMFFIGDNAHSDHKVPMDLGIKAVRYVPAKERYARLHKNEMRFYNGRRCFGSSVIVGLDMLRWVREPCHDYWYDIAYRFGGPVSSFFTRFIISNITKDTGTILFISRDGYNLQKIYEILSGDPIDNHYVYASRMFAVIFGGNITDNKDCAECLFEHFSDAEDIKMLGLPETLSVNDRLAIIRDNTEIFKRLLEKERERYSEYLSGKVCRNGDILLVDVTTKKYSSQRLIHKMLWPRHRITGCYYNLLAHGNFEHSAYADRSGFGLNWNEVNISEFFLGSPEAPVSDVTADGVPVFRKDIDESELFRMSIYENVTRGELDYAADLKAVFTDDIPNIRSDVLDGWIRGLVKDKGSYGPGRLSDIRWAPDTMHNRYRSLIFGPKEVPYMLMDKLKDLIYRIKTK
ncbi:MAG: hypothetical protein FWD92_04595 [Methanomassiliicoccaceae archaeon]|nr:hypothetical protein [Methanomassiliicoccaceae archaeon]